MKSGILAVVNGGQERLDSFSVTREEDGTELETQISVTGVQRTPDGVDITEGRGAREYLTTSEDVSMGLEEVTIEEVQEVETQYCDFVNIHEKFLAIERKQGQYIFDTVADRTGAQIERAEINLDSLYDAHQEVTTWKVGFYDNGDSVNNGTLHGSGILQDPDIGALLAEAPKNQLGLQFTERESNEKVFLTRSGYVSVYQPTDYDTAGFVSFINDVVAPHIEPGGS